MFTVQASDYNLLLSYIAYSFVSYIYIYIYIYIRITEIIYREFTYRIIWMDPTQNHPDDQVSARGVMVIVVGNGHGDTRSKSWTKLIAFHIELIPLGKV